MLGTNPGAELVLVVAAERLGRLPATRGGLLIMVLGRGLVNVDACVATEDVEFERVGEDGPTIGRMEVAEGDGAVGFEGVRWWVLRTGLEVWKGDGGAAFVGVAIGVVWEDETALAPTVLLLRLGTSPVYTWPSSPELNDKVEQKPSEDVMSKVSPSLDQVRSVKVAQCRLLTTQSGVCCSVS